MKRLFFILFCVFQVHTGICADLADPPEPLMDLPEPLSETLPTPERRWYFEARPGYFYFTDKVMRDIFDNGGFTFRAETGYKFWRPLIAWLDLGYFQKTGHAIGGTEEISIKLGTITLGLKAIYYVHDYCALYAGVGPRLFIMMMHNDSPFVRSEDNHIGIGGGFDGGFWVFPFQRNRNVFLDLFVDYSLKKMGVEEDANSSENFDVVASGITAGIGLGGRF